MRALLILLLVAGCSTPDQPASSARVAQFAEGPGLPGSPNAAMEQLRYRAIHLSDATAEGFDAGAWVHTGGGLRAVMADHLVLQDGVDDAWESRLALQGYGRGDDLRPVRPPAVSAWDTRVTLDRGPVKEWYEDRGHEVKQGFFLEERPPGEGDVVLRLAVTGDLTVRAGQEAAWLVDPYGAEAIQIDELVVVDRDGQVLPSRMVADCPSIDRCALELRFDDEGAAWPVEVDPAYVNLAAVKDAFAPGLESVGAAVGISGEWAIVGAPTADLSTSSVMFLRRNHGGADQWGVVQTESGRSAGFGASVAIDGDVAIVGAPGTGTAHIFEFDGASWVEVAQLGGGTSFGTAVAVDDRRVAIGAPLDEQVTGVDVGSVTVCSWDIAVGWPNLVDCSTLASSLQSTNAGLGGSVALRGTTLIAGAPLIDPDGDITGRHAAVFQNQLTGGVDDWVEIFRFDDPTIPNDETDGLGSQVAIADGRVWTTSPRATHASQAFSEGTHHRLILELFPGSTVTTRAPTGSEAYGSSMAASDSDLALSALSAVPGTTRGQVWLNDRLIEVPGAIDSAPVVGLDGGRLIVGVPEANGGLGAVHIFEKNRDTWSDSTVAFGNGSGGLGRSTAVDGRWLAAGAPDGDGFGPNLGEVLVFSPGVGSFLVGPPLAAAPNGFGWSVAMEDGVLAVGDPGDTTNGVAAGAVHVYSLDEPDLWFLPNATELYSTFGSFPLDFYGTAVAVDSSRLVVSAPGTTTEHVRTFLHGAPAAPEAVLVAPGVVESINAPLAYNGRFVAVGIPLAGNAAESGSVAIFDLNHLAGPGGAGALHHETIDGPALEGEFGGAVAFAGNTLFIGAPGMQGAGHAEGGRVRPWTWDGTDFVIQPGWSAATASGQRFGAALSASEDLLVVGSDADGPVVVYARNEGGEDAWGELYRPPSPGAGEQFGASVAVDGSDVLVGAPGYNSGDGRALHSTWTLSATDVEGVADLFVVEEDGTMTGDVVANDLAGTGVPVQFDAFIGPLPTGFVDLGGGAFSWTPLPDFNGDVGLSYTLVGSGEAIPVVLRATPVNDAPISAGESFVVLEDTPLDGNLLENDSDVDPGDVLSILDPGSITLLTGDGTLSVQSNGVFSFQGAQDSEADASFEYVVEDLAGAQSLVATVSIDVVPVNDDPVQAGILAFQTNEDENLLGGASSLLDGISDVDNLPQDLFTSVGVLTGDHGTLEILTTDGQFRYLVDPNAFGTDAFQYEVYDGAGGSVTAQVEVTVNSVDDPPTSPDLERTGWLEDTSNTIDLLAEAFDVEGHAIVGVNISRLPLGTLVPVALGQFQYTPPQDFVGVDSFAATLDGGSVGPEFQVTITVVNVPDPPVVNDLGSPGNRRLTGEDTPLTVSAPGVLEGAYDPDPGDSVALASPAVTVQPNGGIVSVNPNGSFTYTPDLNFSGTDSFDFAVTDLDGNIASATAYLEVNAQNDPPTALPDTYTALEDTTPFVSYVPVLNNDVDPEGGTLSAILEGPPTLPEGDLVVWDDSDGTFAFQPNQDFNGPVTFNYRARDQDGLESASVQVTIHVQPVNDQPVAEDDAYAVTVQPGQPWASALSLLDNDDDVDGDALTAVLDDQAAQGTVVVHPDGQFDYLPKPGFVGDDTFTYVATDGVLDSEPALVTLSVTGPGTGGTGMTGGSGTPGTGAPTDTGDCEPSLWFADADGDGFGDPERVVSACQPPPNHVENDADCDDRYADVSPDGEELSDDGIDQDCDGVDLQIGSAGGGCACENSSGGAPWMVLLALVGLVGARRRAA